MLHRTRRILIMKKRTGWDRTHNLQSKKPHNHIFKENKVCKRRKKLENMNEDNLARMMLLCSRDSQFPVLPPRVAPTNKMKHYLIWSSGHWHEMVELYEKAASCVHSNHRGQSLKVCSAWFYACISCSSLHHVQRISTNYITQLWTNQEIN